MATRLQLDNDIGDQVAQKGHWKHGTFAEIQDSLASMQGHLSELKVRFPNSNDRRMSYGHGPAILASSEPEDEEESPRPPIVRNKVYGPRPNPNRQPDVCVEETEEKAADDVEAPAKNRRKNPERRSFKKKQKIVKMNSKQNVARAERAKVATEDATVKMNLLTLSDDVNGYNAHARRSVSPHPPSKQTASTQERVRSAEMKLPVLEPMVPDVEPKSSSDLTGNRTRDASKVQSKNVATSQRSKRRGTIIVDLNKSVITKSTHAEASGAKTSDKHAKTVKTKHKTSVKKKANSKQK